MAEQSTAIARQPHGRLMTMNEVTADLGVERRTIERWINAGRFPKRIYIGNRDIRFAEREIEDWKQDRRRQ